MKEYIITSVIASAVVMIAGATLLTMMMNDRIDISAKKTYVFMKYLKDDPIKIKTAGDSVVTLTGTVSEWSHRLLAEETVAGLPGVRRVENNLKAASGHPTEDSDAWIGMKVKTMLMFQRNVSDIKTDIDVKEGAVTLRGRASSEAQKELTAGYVSDVQGVQSVKNNMTANEQGKSTIEKARETVDDVSITTQVKIALLFHRSTNILKMKVVTNNGIVTLGGVAGNSAEKERAGKLVNDIHGVKGLINVISIG